jgi:hypothetical protein
MCSVKIVGNRGDRQGVHALADDGLEEEDRHRGNRRVQQDRRVAVGDGWDELDEGVVREGRGPSQDLLQRYLRDFLGAFFIYFQF